VKKTWTQSDVDALEQCIRSKVKDGVKLTAGEDTCWGVLKAGKHLSVYFVNEVDFMMSIDYDGGIPLADSAENDNGA
jgi:hypothetical protein